MLKKINRKLEYTDYELLNHAHTHTHIHTNINVLLLSYFHFVPLFVDLMKKWGTVWKRLDDLTLTQVLLFREHGPVSRLESITLALPPPGPTLP